MAAQRLALGQTAGGDQRVDQAEFVRFNAKDDQAASPTTVAADGGGTTRCHAGRIMH